MIRKFLPLFCKNVTINDPLQVPSNDDDTISNIEENVLSGISPENDKINCNNEVNWLLPINNNFLEEEEKPDERDDLYIGSESYLHQSTIYVKTNQGNFYVLKFFAEKANIQLVNPQKRSMPDTMNEKAIQPYSKVTFDHHLSRGGITKLMYLDRIFSTFPKKDIISYRKPVFKNLPNKVNYIVPPLIIRNKALCEPKPREAHVIKPSLKSIIHVRKGNILLRINAGVLKLESVRPFSDNKEQIEKILGALNINKENMGSFLTRCKRDLIRINFCMKDLVYSKIKTKISRGAQVFDNNVYWRVPSTVPRRPYTFNHISIPRSTYMYVDPLPFLRSRNLTNRLKQIGPAWMPEMRKKRLKENFGRGMANSNNKSKRKKSFVTFEGLYCMVSAKCGIVKCDIIEGLKYYELEILERQMNKAMHDIKPSKGKHLIDEVTINPCALQTEVGDFDLENFKE